MDQTLFKPGEQNFARKSLGLVEAPTLLFVGRIQEFKGLDVAIEALSLSANNDVRLVVVGGLSGNRGTETYLDIRRRIERCGLEERILFVDPQPHQLLPTYYQAADACLVPSRSESFGLVALEAAACGLPVIASNVGGLRDNVVDGVTGLLVNERDPAEFAAAIDNLLEHQELRRLMGRRGVERASLNSWGLGASNAIDVFRRLISRELVSCA